jgi:hypothetical protein
MRPLLLLLALAALPAKEAAATVIAETSLDSGTPQVVIDQLSAVSSQLGVNGFDDLGIDEAFASADIRTGELRFRTRDGLQTGQSSTAVSAFASLQETITFAHNPALGPLTYGLLVNFSSTPALFEDTFPLFNQPAFGGIGGINLQAFSRASFSVLEPVTVSGAGLPPFLRSFGVLEQRVSGSVIGRVGDANPPQIRNVNVTEQGFSGTLGDVIGQTSQVSAVNPVVTASASTFFEGSIAIDLVVNDSLTFDVLLESSGGAVGGYGTYTGVSSLNTARISLDLPEGGTFTSASGLFLTADNATPIPAPGSGLLFAAATIFVGYQTRRQRRDNRLMPPTCTMTAV